MGRLVMATLELNEEEMEMVVKDIQRIVEVPNAVREVIKQNVHGRRLLKSGLPSVTYLGPERTQVIGAFTYGGISFLEIEGKWKNIIEGDSLVCITAYREGKSYKELKEGREEYKKQIKEKYPNGLIVGGESNGESDD